MNLHGKSIDAATGEELEPAFHEAGVEEAAQAMEAAAAAFAEYSPCGQLRAFATLVREGSWVDARIDTALPERKPQPPTVGAAQRSRGHDNLAAICAGTD